MARLILAPLRGVTIRCFRRVFADVLRETGFTEAVLPFIPANAGIDPLRDRELAHGACAAGLLETPQFIGKDPAALKRCLERVRGAGYATADLNAGCPFPMVRNKGRGSGLLRQADTLARMLEAGCETMGAGRFSLKARLGVERPDELLRLMPLINQFPLRRLVVHARTARQMYEGTPDRAAYAAIAAEAKVPLCPNGDIGFPCDGATEGEVMIGRGFVRRLADLADIGERLDAYIRASAEELCGERPVIGRIKELVAYWKDLPRWRRRWSVAKLAASLDELRDAIRAPGAPVGFAPHSRPQQARGLLSDC